MASSMAGGLAERAGLSALVGCFAVTATALGYLCYCLLSRPRVPAENKPYGVLRDGVLWRSSSVGRLVTSPGEGVNSVWAAIERSAKLRPTARAVGQRAVLKREFVPDPAQAGKVVEKVELGAYEWLTLGEYRDRASSLGAGLVALTGLKQHGRVVIYGETHRDWMLAALGVFRQGGTVVTVYATLGEVAVVHACNQTKATVAITDAKLLPVLLSCVGQCTHLRHVVTLSGAVPGEGRARLEALRVTIHTLDECLHAGTAAPVEAVAPAPEDVSVIMYTSGTTGRPKGVQITQGNIVACVAGVKLALCGLLGPDDVYLVRARSRDAAVRCERIRTPFPRRPAVGMSSSGDAHMPRAPLATTFHPLPWQAYLPLAHIMEIGAEVVMMWLGVPIGYGSPHTLTSAGPKLKEGQTGDAPLLRPTVLVFAPAVLDRVYAGVRAKVADSPRFVRCLFHAALRSGFASFVQGGVGAGWLWNMLVFHRVQATLGGRLRYAVSASAPLAADVQRFVQTVFNAPIRQAYGLTEVTGGAVLTAASDNSTDTVGPPCASACIRLRDWEEGGYTSADKDRPDVGMPRGEVLIGGPLVTKGYLVDPDVPDPEVEERNNTDYVSIGGVRYFCSGDIGQITADGNLQIIDRKKDLVKLQQGEYVALSKVEAALKACKYVAIPMVYARSEFSFCVALVCPSVQALSAFAESHGIAATNPHDLCTHQRIVEEVAAACVSACKAAKLASFEIPTKVGLVAEPWTPENEMLTAAMKIKRAVIVATYKAQLDELYTS